MLKLKFVASMLLIILGASCIVIEDTTYLELIPEETIYAYRFGSQIKTKLQAVIAGRQELLSSPHFYCVNTPEVFSVEKLSYQEAINRVEQLEITSYVDQLQDAQVWLVIFECDIQVDNSPFPEENETPEVPVKFHGCIYSIIEVSGAIGGEIRTIKCP